MANDGVDLVVEPGEIHALLGENGAGKTTLMNVLYGLYQPDDGEILIDEVPVTFAGPGEAMAAGIGMVHQHFMLVPVFTVAENVVLGYEPVKGGLIDLTEARRRVREISDRFGFDVDPDALIEDLPVGAQQRVEIIKALSREAKVLILDEPTAVLTPQETDELMAVMRQLRDAGTSIVFITHKLREVRAVADRITVIRRGKVVGSALPSAPETETRLPHGRPVRRPRRRAQAAQPGEVPSCWSTAVLDAAGVLRSDRVTFDMARGEILAVAGVQGNGQTELTEVILGLRTADRRIREAGRHRACRVVGPPGAARRGRLRPRGPHGRRAGGRLLRRGEPGAPDLYDQPPFGKGVWSRRRSARTPSGARSSSTSAPPRSSRSRARCRAATSRRWSSPGSCRGRSAC